MKLSKKYSEKGLKSNGGKPALSELEGRFLTIKVKQQFYMGKEAIAIYMNDVTKKISGQLMRL